jgi:hypothetical protein
VAPASEERRLTVESAESAEERHRKPVLGRFACLAPGG